VQRLTAYGEQVDTRTPPRRWCAGNLYVTDFGNHRVLKLAAGSSTPTVLPFTGLQTAGSVAVDAAGNPYVTDSNGVVKLPAG
jgi:serine/threonine-protein kinase